MILVFRDSKAISVFRALLECRDIEGFKVYRVFEVSRAGRAGRAGKDSDSKVFKVGRVTKVFRVTASRVTRATPVVLADSVLRGFKVFKENMEHRAFRELDLKVFKVFKATRVFKEQAAHRVR